MQIEHLDSRRVEVVLMTCRTDHGEVTLVRLFTKMKDTRVCIHVVQSVKFSCGKKSFRCADVAHFPKPRLMPKDKV